jgi:hypothetical protein
MGPARTYGGRVGPLAPKYVNRLRPAGPCETRTKPFSHFGEDLLKRSNGKIAIRWLPWPSRYLPRLGPLAQSRAALFFAHE